MSLFKRPKSLGYIPGPRPRLPDESESPWRAIGWVALIAVAVIVAVLFGKKG